MYGALWRRLPGRRPLRIVLALLLAATSVALLWFVIFPWLEPLLPTGDPLLPTP
ncbi:hypothetical protein Aple_009970 [Acrocarpospora pleiomorpha]|uniref:Oligopeptide transport permease C-like N-terminal domain-containing protein n=1 Tax=Acrocarpospora pleiomorpha TaxID=90975 RepID=A0A5M3XBG6_9ACTN|nr:hypothetical protein [Acrocarpospora pleiomorpha]GES18102.1 hypothetical protein Aple_009970 [Acrocarpospora pleiomorpha]